MITSLILPFASASLLVAAFTWAIWWIWGAPQAVIGGFALFCVVATSLLAPRLEFLVLSPIASYVIGFLAVVGLAAILLVAGLIACESRSPYPFVPKRIRREG